MQAVRDLVDRRGLPLSDHASHSRSSYLRDSPSWAMNLPPADSFRLDTLHGFSRRKRLACWRQKRIYSKSMEDLSSKRRKEYRRPK